MAVEIYPVSLATYDLGQAQLQEQGGNPGYADLLREQALVGLTRERAAAMLDHARRREAGTYRQAPERRHFEARLFGAAAQYLDRWLAEQAG